MMNIHYRVENYVSLSLLPPSQQALNILPKLAQLWASIADDCRVPHSAGNAGMPTG